jgi:hypothetical protein
MADPGSLEAVAEELFAKVKTAGRCSSSPPSSFECAKSALASPFPPSRLIDAQLRTICCCRTTNPLICFCALPGSLSSLSLSLSTPQALLCVRRGAGGRVGHNRPQPCGARRGYTLWPKLLSGLLLRSLSLSLSLLLLAAHVLSIDVYS